MVTEKAMIQTEAVYSDDKTHRFLIKRVWDSSLPSACIIMFTPSHTADTVAFRYDFDVCD